MVQPAQLQCKLLSGGPALLAQLLLAVLAFTSLIYKRHRERPQRPYRVWTMDVSKQIFSSGAGHICGLIIALVASNRQGHSTSECAWYFVAYTFDTTLGVTLAVLLHRLLVRWAARRRAAPDPEAALERFSWVQAVATCGDYGDPPSWKRWSAQMAEWVFATVAARGVCGIVVVAAHKPLRRVAHGLDVAFHGKPTAELFAVMICCPLLMNMIQAWVQDAVLKLKRGLGVGVAAADPASSALLSASAPRSDGVVIGGGNAPAAEPLPAWPGLAGGKRGGAIGELPTLASPMEGSVPR